MEQRIENWFRALRDEIINKFQIIEKQQLKDFSQNLKKLAIKDPEFKFKNWTHKDKGGGEYAIMHGNIFEKIGVNISSIESNFSEKISNQVKYASPKEKFFATGLSLVSHMNSPWIPAIHFNTRYIRTTSAKWFGGGIDLTPTYPDQNETDKFHQKLKSLCDKHNKNFYDQFKQNCDDYFFINHRNEPRGIGGIFFDYMIDDLEKNFLFVKDLGKFLIPIYSEIISNKMHKQWTDEEKNYQLIKRGRYVEFNLIYDRGTKFGLESGGNIDAIFMSLPPQVKWP